MSPLALYFRSRKSRIVFHDAAASADASESFSVGWKIGARSFAANFPFSMSLLLVGGGGQDGSTMGLCDYFDMVAARAR